MKVPRVAVVGGGIIGLSTALQIQRLIPHVEIKIISEKWSPHTTADGAAGIFGLYLMGSTPVSDQIRWAQTTHDWLERIWKSPDSSLMGVSLVSSVRFNHQQIPPVWRDVVFGFREMSAEEVGSYGRLSGSHQTGTEFTTFTAEPAKFLPQFMDQFEAAGGEFVCKKINDLKELSEYDVIVNCTGLGANQLVGDMTVQPLRGQVMRVKAPWLRICLLDDEDDGNYVLPNIDNVVLGGTHQHEDWDTNPREEDTEYILLGSSALEPSLVHSIKQRDWVGLRPGRSEVRLEREGEKIVHNYGHGGSGITVFQGCAEDAACLVQEVLMDQQLSKL